ncbi:protein RETICULATA-RELATED 4, chloroplastic [Phalaenopsis equestris]|uniref:protein RETICULATA-RELATED 4, chloroplastic n=1 Tax=Phalaenopsis equestris TaxID=78828 RepID=UPI0009E3EE56|nr:protein RETICULATA-RELATED 4, chloroplastic [Phalaenopsis equestris]XP_020598572.1 protein RETICULATA-RELATED 4, chloroplastic [Phalaenopsis equestris]
MAMAAVAAVSSSSLCSSGKRLRSISHRPSSSRFLATTVTPSSHRLQIFRLRPTRNSFLVGSGSGDGGFGSGNSGGGGGGGGGDEGSSGKNRTEAILALAEIGRSADSLPADFAAAVDAGRIPGEIVYRLANLEKSPIFRWLLQFGGFKERLLADDLFLAKVAMECGVGIFTKTAAEWERRRENFMKELDFVFADVVMAIIADFMLVWLPAPTVSLRPPLAVTAGRIAKFFYGCPDNAFQVALSGTSYSFLQRIGAIVRNGAKLFVVGTSASLVGTGVTNALIKARKLLDKDFAVEAEEVPLVETSIAYGVYMAVSSNLRYQIVAGVVEQRILEPLLHNQKLLLSALCFAVRTGNTFLGSLLWVDYARWVGVQKIRE